MAKTIDQIANDLNLSVTTVRLVLSGKAEQYRISAKTQRRINEYVDRYGYVLNHSARSLKLNKTDTLGLIVPNISNVFFATLAEKLELRCRRSGYQLTISCTYDDIDYENKLVRTLISRNVDGLFVIPASLENQQHHQRLVKKPIVLLDRNFRSSPAALVESENKNGGQILAEKLLTGNATPVWFLAGDAELPSIHDRIEGYLHALKKQGIDHDAWVRVGVANTPQGGKHLMKQLLDVNERPAGFIASSLPVLEGAIEALREHYGELPSDINIGTFDEHPMLSFLSNNVWSMQQDEDAWAENAFDLMQRGLEGERINQTIQVPMKLISRLSQV